jgi:hypothetical protein
MTSIIGSSELQDKIVSHEKNDRDSKQGTCQKNGMIKNAKIQL